MKTLNLIIVSLLVSQLIIPTAYADIDFRPECDPATKGCVYDINSGTWMDLSAFDKAVAEAEAQERAVKEMTPIAVPSEGKQNPICMQQLIYKENELDREKLINSHLYHRYKDEKQKGESGLPSWMWFAIGGLMGVAGVSFFYYNRR